MNTNSKDVILKEISKATDKKAYCNFIRHKIDENLLGGYPLLLSEELCLLAYDYDFFADGYRIIRTRDITDIRLGETEQFYQRILEDEMGFKDTNFIPPIMNVSSMYDILSTIEQMNDITIIECENSGKFYIGNVKKVNKTSIYFHEFDGLGEWNTEYVKININSITLIALDSNYIKGYSRYFRNVTSSKKR